MSKNGKIVSLHLIMNDAIAYELQVLGTQPLQSTITTQTEHRNCLVGADNLLQVLCHSRWNDMIPDRFIVCPPKLGVFTTDT